LGGKGYVRLNWHQLRGVARNEWCCPVPFEGCRLKEFALSWRYQKEATQIEVSQSNYLWRAMITTMECGSCGFVYSGGKRRWVKDWYLVVTTPFKVDVDKLTLKEGFMLSQTLEILLYLGTY
jgi:hypothetical protein